MQGDFMALRRMFRGDYSGLWRGFLVDVAEEVIKRLVHLHIHVHVDLNRIDRVVGIDAEAAHERERKRDEEDEALHGMGTVAPLTPGFNE